MGRPAPASDAPSAPMKQSEMNVSRTAELDEALLRLVKLPSRGESAPIFGRVGVADHDLEAAANAGPVPRQIKEVRHDFPGCLEVRYRFEKRNDAQRLGDSRLLLQELDGKHVTRPTGHRNDVRAERISREAREHAKRVQDLLDLIRGGHVLRNERSLRPKLGDEKLLTLRFVPVAVRAEFRGAESARRVPARDGTASWRMSSRTMCEPKQWTPAN